MQIFDISKRLDALYDVADVSKGFNYWFNKLLNVCLKIFDYENLPAGIPQREIELNLLLTGHAIIIANPQKPGELFTPLASIAGVSEYYQPTWAVFSNPVVKSSKRYIIDEDCVCIYNNSLQDSYWYIMSDGSMYSFIARYARQLADIESSINIYTVNTRITNIPVTDDNTVLESIKLFFKKWAMGKRAIVTDSSIVEKFRNVEVNSHNADGINDLLVARDKILEQFFRDIGVRMYNPKKAQIIESEVESNDQLLLISTDDMLKCRIEGIEKMNDMFGTNASVKLNPKFDINDAMFNTNIGGAANETSNNRLS